MIPVTSVLGRVDHLVYATPDLEEGVRRIEDLTGVRASEGGSHPGRGTRNALLALAGDSYLEIIGPDPQQPAPAEARPFGVDRLAEPRLVTWAAQAPDIEQHVARARRRGFDPGQVISMSRDLPGGDRLEWRLTLPPAAAVASDEGSWLVPFLIDWGETPHPSRTSAGGCRLVGLRAEHPQPETAQAALDALELPLKVELGAAVLLEASLETPRGSVRLR